MSQLPEPLIAPNTKTVHIPGLISSERATNLYEFLQSNAKWQDGIYSRAHKKVSRKAIGIEPNEESEDIIESEVSKVIVECLSAYTSRNNIRNIHAVLGIYINYDRDGQDWAPSHSHGAAVQLVLSLGATRKLIVGKKTYEMKNGDVIVFGSSQHEVPMEPEVKDGRISIATFMKKF